MSKERNTVSEPSSCIEDNNIRLQWEACSEPGHISPQKINIIVDNSVRTVNESPDCSQRLDQQVETITTQRS